MRKIGVLFLTVVLILGLCSCEKTQIEKAQDKIVEIGEQFLNYELTANEAEEKLDSIVIPETEGNGSLHLSVNKDTLSLLILKTKTNSATFEEIQDKINYIKNSDFED